MKLMIATPTMSGDLCHEYVQSLVCLIADLNSHGVAVDYRVFPGSCYVSLARNELAAQFMESDCDRLLFIDADLGFQPDGARKLIAANKDIVCGLYRFKTDDEAYPSWVDTNDAGIPTVVGGLISLSMGPTGFMMIKRHVFEAMRAQYPDRELAPTEGKPAVWDFFGTERVERTWFGDDANFCRLWCALAGHGIGEFGKIWAVPDLKFAHVGRKRFEGNWHEYMLRRPGGSLDPARKEAA